MQFLIKIVWFCLCVLAGAGLIGALLGLKFESWPLAIVGGLVGAVLGVIFAKLVSPVDFLFEAMS